MFSSKLTVGNICLFVICFPALLVFSDDLTAQTRSTGVPLQSEAVLNYRFDESGGDAVDSAISGVYPDYGKLTNGAVRVASPFWNQGSRKALKFDASKKQFLRAENSGDLHRPDALSISLFFLSLHAPNDAGYHGIVAKHSTGKDASASAKTNYGIRFNHQKDELQVWVNDGKQMRAAVYSAKQTIGDRRRAYLTATLQNGDAPERDEDSDADDMRVRFYVNGKLIQPKAFVQGQVAGGDVWFTDLNLAGLVNDGDGPLTVGSSATDKEFTSGIVDELSIFPRALSPEEAAALFSEVAGPNAARLAERDTRRAPRPPRMTSLSQRGLQIGQTTRITIRGNNLSPDAAVVLPFSDLTQRVLPKSGANRLLIDLTIPRSAPVGICPLRIRTPYGISNALPVVLDRLFQADAGSTSPEKPARLPSAFSGKLSGATRARIYFRGKADDRILADVEARRLGSRFQPVLEIKTKQGTPLTIQWGKTHLQGDVRAEVKLPEDGIYYAELHDLSYKAFPGSDYRIKLGNLKFVDATFPPLVARGRNVRLELIGPGIEPGTTFTTKIPEVLQSDRFPLRLPEALGLYGAAPFVRVGDGREIVEKPTTGEQLQVVQAKFNEQQTPCIINGRISETGERDRFVLNVEPGQKLHLSVDARSIDSPLDAGLLICEHPSGKVLATSTDSAGSRDPQLDYTVPEKVQAVQAAVNDLHKRGGDRFLYRLVVAPANRPRFDLLLDTPEVTLPAHGSAVIQLQVKRRNYGGPIRLHVPGDENVTISPTLIAKENGNSTLLATVTHHGDDPAADLSNLKIVGESVDTKPIIRRTAVIAGGAQSPAIPGYEDHLVMAVSGTMNRSLKIQKSPKQIFQGTPTQIKLQFAGNAAAEQTDVVRYSLVSTEKPRSGRSLFQPNAGNKPLVRVGPEQYSAVDAETETLNLTVPEDVSDKNISFVVRADLVSHRYSRNVLGTVYSQPIRVPVRVPVNLQLTFDAAEIVKGSFTRFRGTITHNAAFKKNVDIEFGNLPKGCTAPPVTVLPGQKEFELVVKAEDDSVIVGPPFVTLDVKTTGGGKLLPTRLMVVRLLPKPKASMETAGKD